MALTNDDITRIEQMIDDRSSAAAADTFAELSAQQIAVVVRQVLDEDGARVDNYDEVPPVESLSDELAQLWSMPLVRRTAEGLAQEYRQTPLDALAAFIAKQVEDKYPDSVAAYEKIKEVLAGIDGLELALQWATNDEVASEAEKALAGL